MRVGAAVMSVGDPPANGCTLFIVFQFIKIHLKGLSQRPPDIYASLQALLCGTGRQIFVPGPLVLYYSSDRLRVRFRILVWMPLIANTFRCPYKPYAIKKVSA